MKHTPGPWTADAQAEIRSEDGKYIACVGDPSFISRTDDEANARLIAAAPELLAALEAARTVMEVEGENDLDEWLATLTQMVAAIAKAEGGSL